MGFLPILDIVFYPFLTTQRPGPRRNVRSTSSLIGHDALRGGNDCGAQALHDLRHILAVGVDAQARLGHTAQTSNNGSPLAWYFRVTTMVP